MSRGEGDIIFQGPLNKITVNILQALLITDELDVVLDKEYEEIVELRVLLSLLTLKDR